MHGDSQTPILNCGRIRRVKFPQQLSMDDPPVTLAEVAVNTGKVNLPSVLFNYSQVLSFQTTGANLDLTITYRLIRISRASKTVKNLEEWTFRGAEIIPTDVPDLDTIEPLVVNFCDTGLEKDQSFVYRFQLAEVITNNARYRISDQVITAIVLDGASD
ncbi:DUF4489 domain-containing protein [Pseudalkalibacillus sp. Hm43]|uniref:DUF4489 domain-containing protein n=1 Tax=Pseudalkalibacillus sp. Hm43 TaxID=3450742 RepID=UPI003F436205